jgi:membrane-associated protease RseP (regulator of RpoE activity)
VLLERPAGFGVGGEVPGKMGRLPEFRLGAYAMDSPIVNFSTDIKGAMATPGMAGVIGSKVLSRFRVIFDYPGSRMILEPNESFGDPFEFDSFGAHFVLRDGNLELFSVVPGTPASESGFEPGDRITSVNERPAAEMDLEDLEELFLDPDHEHTITILRGGESKTMNVRTRKLL